MTITSHPIVVSSISQKNWGCRYKRARMMSLLQKEQEQGGMAFLFQFIKVIQTS